MTVAQLIKTLRTLPKDAEVYVEVDGYWSAVKELAVKGNSEVVLLSSEGVGLPDKFERKGQTK
jgi:hypothetical protein